MIRADCGDPTVLINNAGIAHEHTILDGSDEYDERLFRVNVLSHFTLIREFLPGMLSQKKGHIVTVASMASYYSCAGLNVELRNRYGPAGKNIVTSIVHPMWAQTSIISSWEASLRRTRTKILKPTDISDKIVTQVLRGEPAQIYVPKSMSAYVGIKAWPHWLQELVRDDGNKRTKPFEEGKGKGRISDVGIQLILARPDVE
ncbi:putative short-chain dehydrogenase reductase protein [Neofusicoccum parvum UCRNP2]|uniref:Putative short-chain dehydrogenase reductase protein n=1 Tax=Botryosphaeria parva (strain UCR-NP2) TaxID=1287680 RepID=R1GKJ2_BOTPV|nr:putative short-chain dehydrogenase reductase protein [Neofusicoccum parvum UCRNP2]